MGATIVYDNKRQLHDSWALFLYIITFAATNTIFLLNMRSFDSSKVFENIKMSALGFAILKNVILLASGIFFTLFCFIMIPRFIIYASLIIMPIASIVGIIYSGYHAFSMAALCILNLLAFAMFFFFIHKHIDYICAVASASASILKKYLFTIMGVLILTNILIVVHAFIIFLSDWNNIVVKYAYIPTVLLVFWTIGILNYFLYVFTSCLFVEHVNSKVVDTPVRHRAFRNTFYALGSICLGALLLAIIQTLKFLLSESEEERRRNNAMNNRRTSSLGSEILYCLVKCFLDILEDFVKFTNGITFPYIAIHGTSYKESVHGSFQLISAKGGRALASSFAVEMILSLLFLCFMIIGFFINVKITKNTNGEYDIASTSYEMMGYILSLSIFFALMSLLSAGVLTLAFIHLESSQTLKEFDSDLNETIERKKVSLEDKYY